MVVTAIILSCSNNPNNPNTELEPPSNLVLIQLNSDSIQLNWQDNSTEEEGFRIDRKIGDSDWEINYKILSENSTTFIDSELITIENYTYRVYAFTDDEYSDYIEENLSFSYDEVFGIEPYFSGQNNLSYGESIDLTITLYDSLGNPVQHDYDVWFKFIGCPDGTNINNTLFGSEDSLAIQSQNGQVQATLNAGYVPGQVAIKVYVYNSANDEISFIKSNILVHTNQVTNVEITYGGINSGINLGNGIWQIEVAALATDSFGNLVDYGSAVWYSLEDPDTPGIAPEWASITSEAYIGNENANGDSIPGNAFTQLEYEGTHSNEELIVWVDFGCFPDFMDSTIITLPIQFPTMDVVVTPAHLEGFYPGEPDSVSTSVKALLLDGQNNPIYNQQVVFSCDLGTTYDMGTDDDNDIFTENTGIPPDQPGQVDKDWIFYKNECPPPVGNEPGTIATIMIITVTGTELETEIPFTLYRYP